MPANHRLGRSAVTLGEREFRVSDQVLCRRNDHRLGLRNGIRGTVIGPGGHLLASDVSKDHPGLRYSRAALARRRAQAVSWIAVYYREGGPGVELSEEQIAAGVGPDPAPARAFLNALPLSPRAGLRATIVAVRDRPPPSLPTGSQAWRLMHKPAKKGEVDMSGIFEARDRHRRKLYRLFCVLDSRAPEHGLAAPALVMRYGTVKNVGEEVPQAAYREVRRQADRYFATTPRPVIPFS